MTHLHALSPACITLYYSPVGLVLFVFSVFSRIHFSICVYIITYLVFFSFFRIVLSLASCLYHYLLIYFLFGSAVLLTTTFLTCFCIGLSFKEYMFISLCMFPSLLVSFPCCFTLMPVCLLLHVILFMYTCLLGYLYVSFYLQPHYTLQQTRSLASFLRSPLLFFFKVTCFLC